MHVLKAILKCLGKGKNYLYKHNILSSKSLQSIKITWIKRNRCMSMDTKNDQATKYTKFTGK